METLVGNPEEIADLRWVKKQELDQWLYEKQEDFSAWFVKAYALVCDKMKEMKLA